MRQSIPAERNGLNAADQDNCLARSPLKGGVRKKVKKCNNPPLTGTAPYGLKQAKQIAGSLGIGVFHPGGADDEGQPGSMTELA